MPLMSTQSARAIPDVIIGGAPRSGTTFLATMLDQHPGVYVAKPYIPEPKICLMAAKSSGEYNDRYLALFKDAPNNVCLIEKTSNYFENMDALMRLASLNNGQFKFLFILREPVARAYSNYLWSKQNGLETLDFNEALSLEGQRDSPFPPERSYVRPFDYLTRGYYDIYAERYLKEFGPNRVKFILYENLFRNSADTQKEIQDFIGLEHTILNSFENTRINALHNKQVPLAPELEGELRARMTPSVKRFSMLTGLDVTIWGY